ncbi:hypothetical protein ABW21_db0202087 [Orbilia brochopaga]|nr:hypothetical protein ABW21_db0202087 [Drechslerella brochopaga]
MYHRSTTMPEVTSTSRHANDIPASATAPNENPKQNSVDVKQETRPAVFHELIEEKEHENVTRAVDREIHQHHHHVYIQPVTETIVEDEQHHNRTVPTEHRTRHHGKEQEVATALAHERDQFRNTQHVLPATDATSTSNTVVGEHIHHHVHNIIQPVIERQRVVPHIVHTTVPIHEHIEHEPYIHKGTVLPAITLDEFLKRGYSLDGSKQPLRDPNIVYEGSKEPFGGDNAAAHTQRNGAYENHSRVGSPSVRLQVPGTRGSRNGNGVVANGENPDAYAGYTGNTGTPSPIVHKKTAATGAIAPGGQGGYDNATRVASPAASLQVPRRQNGYAGSAQGVTPTGAYTPVNTTRATAAGIREPAVGADGYRQGGSPALYAGEKRASIPSIHEPAPPPRLQLPTTNVHGGYGTGLRGPGAYTPHPEVKEASPTSISRATALANNRAAASALQVPGGLGGYGRVTRDVSPAEASAASLGKKSYTRSEEGNGRKKSAVSSPDTDSESRAARSVFNDKEKEDEERERQRKKERKREKKEAKKAAEREEKEREEKAESPTTKKHSWLDFLSPRRAERAR